jgi:hypothetical protein
MAWHLAHRANSATDAAYHPVWEYKVACVHLAAAVVAVQVERVAVPAIVGGSFAVWYRKHSLGPLASHRMAGEHVLFKNY